MKKILFSIAAFCCISTTLAQDILTPANSLFEKKWIRKGRSEMGYYLVKDGQQVEICTFEIDIHFNSETLAVYTKLQFLNSTDQWRDTSISDANTFKPIYRSSYSSDKEYTLKYGNIVTGNYYNKKAKKQNIIKDAASANYFDSYSYPYLIGLLPLKAGYKNDLKVYDYKPENDNNVKKARIEEVKSNVYVSKLTGEHKVWQVSVFEDATKDYYEYYIDKESRRIWKIEIRSNGQQFVLIDREIDFNPFTTKFDKEETLKLIKNGTSVISGEAFARDNENEGLLKGMAVLNINKKQYARQGTTILLIPYTDFFKEWIKLNEASRKKGRAIPLPPEVLQCMKTTTVYDSKGSFEFVNLMPGEYLLYTEFGYVHTSRRTEVIGYTDTYINGIFQGTSENTTVNTYNTNTAAAIKKVVTIKRGDENISVKLKKTL